MDRIDLDSLPIPEDMRQNPVLPADNGSGFSMEGLAIKIIRLIFGVTGIVLSAFCLFLVMYVVVATAHFLLNTDPVMASAGIAAGFLFLFFLFSQTLIAFLDAVIPF